MFCRLAKMRRHRPFTAIAMTAGLFAACLGIKASCQSECAAPQSLATAVRVRPTAANYIDFGNWFGNQRQFGCATEAFRASLKLDPRSPMALDGLSRALLADDDSADVVALLATARLNEALTVDLGRAMVKQGKYDDAVQTLSQGLTKYPSSQALTNELGGVYILENDGDRAVPVAESPARARPGDLEAQRFYLRTLVTKSDEARAVPLAHRLLAIAPSDADLLYLAGTIERMAADYPAARGHLERSAAIDPGNADCHDNLGLTLAHLGDPTAAKAELERALELGETDPAVHFELAMEMRNLGQPEQAKAEIKLYEAGKEAKAKRTLAAVKSTAAGKPLRPAIPGSAAALFREACDAQPQDAMLAFKLARALDQTGDMNAERAALERALDIDPSFALAQAQLGYVESQLAILPPRKSVSAKRCAQPQNMQRAG